jgi:hypothetical protein
MLINKSRWVQCPRPTHVTQPCNARSSWTDHGNAVALCFRLELAPARGFTHAVPPRRLLLATANSRPKHLQNEMVPGIGQKNDGRGQNVACRNSPQLNLPIIFRPEAAIYRLTIVR